MQISTVKINVGVFWWKSIVVELRKIVSG